MSALPLRRDPGLGVRMAMQVGPLARLVVDEEEGDSLSRIPLPRRSASREGCARSRRWDDAIHGYPASCAIRIWFPDGRGTDVPAVRLVGRLLRELDPILIQAPRRSRRRHPRRRRAHRQPLGHQVLELAEVSSSNTGGPGTAGSVSDTSSWHGTPTESSENFPCRERRCRAALGQLLRVEGERLILVVHPNARV